MLPNITNKQHHLGSPRPMNLVCQDTAIKNLALRTTNQKKYLALYRVVEHLQMNQLRKKLEIKVGLACTIMLLVCQAAAMFFQRVLCVSKGLDLSALTHTQYIHTHTHNTKNKSPPCDLKSTNISLIKGWATWGKSAIWDRNCGLGEGTLSEFTDFCRFPTASKASSDRGYAVFSPVIRQCKLLKHLCWTYVASSVRPNKDSKESNLWFCLYFSDTFVIPSHIYRYLWYSLIQEFHMASNISISDGFNHLVGHIGGPMSEEQEVQQRSHTNLGFAPKQRDLAMVIRKQSPSKVVAPPSRHEFYTKSRAGIWINMIFIAQVAPYLIEKWS